MVRKAWKARLLLPLQIGTPRTDGLLLDRLNLGHNTPPWIRLEHNTLSHRKQLGADDDETIIDSPCVGEST